MKKSIILSLAIFLSACGTVVKNDGAPAADSETTAASNANLNEAQKAYTKVNAQMHKGMGIIHEDADIAFIQGMIPHHQGAVDMANIILEHGDDEEAKELARNVIKAQEEEIAWMKNWLKERNLKPIEIPQDIDHSAMGH